MSQATYPRPVGRRTLVTGAQTPRQAGWYTGKEEDIVAAQCLTGRIQPSAVAAPAHFLASADSGTGIGRQSFIDAGWR